MRKTLRSQLDDLEGRHALLKDQYRELFEENQRLRSQLDEKRDDTIARLQAERDEAVKLRLRFEELADDSEKTAEGAIEDRNIFETRMMEAESAVERHREDRARLLKLLGLSELQWVMQGGYTDTDVPR